MQIRDKKFTDYGARLKRIRKSLNLTLDAIYQETGISRSYVSEFERGVRLPTSKYLIHLVEKYGVSMDYVFHGIGDPFVTNNEKDKSDALDFGKHEDDVMDMMFHMANVPVVLYEMLGFFSEIKFEKETMIKRILEKAGKLPKNQMGEP